VKDSPMTSLERVFMTLGYKEPDRVPFFLLLTMHGAKELGLSIKDYFSKSENVVDGQLRLRNKYKHDCYYPFFYAGIEIEAWGGEVIFIEDGPPNTGEPIITNFEQINSLQTPDIRGNSPILKVLSTISQLKSKIGNDAPIIGVVMSPFSLPVMQMGFDKYLDLMFEHPELFNKLISINEAFCINWANAQLEAGATAICYFDPISSTTIVTPDMYQQSGFQIARRVIGKINGPTATHFASGRCLPIIPDVIETGTAMIGFSYDEDPVTVKEACKGKMSLLGNLNGIEMRRWTQSQAESNVRDLIKKAGPGGGFILSDNHGEIPFQVPDDTLLSISEAVQRWGNYPKN